MRTPRVVLLLALAAPLLGNDCNFAARVGGPPPPPPPPPDGGGPPPGTGGGGVIIVTSADAAVPPGTAAATRVETALVASVLATSVLPMTATTASLVSTEDTPTRPSSLRTWELDSTPRAIASDASFAAPEPSGLLLFVLGLGIVSAGVRAMRERE